MDASAAHIRWVALALMAAAALVAGLPPLHEMDLAQHLATGEWIALNRAVPFTEPFAWTRDGQPYFAYSWLAQLTYFLLLDRIGPLGLHLLAAGIVGAAVGSAFWAARQFRWPVEACAAVAVLHLALLWGVANTLRPQQLLFIAVPLAWGIAARIHHRGLNAPRLAALAAVAALAANTHLFFPLTAAPIAYFALVDGRLRTWGAAGMATLLGWLLTPYALVWPQVFALNFGDNVLLRRPPAILEFVPGFEYAVQRTGVLLAAGALLAAPWLIPADTCSRRERIVRALCWTCGLVLFAYAGRLVLAWWTLAFPLVGAAVSRIHAAVALLPSRRIRRAAILGSAAVVFTASAPPISPVFWLFEGDTVHRMLPRAGEEPALWLASWLLCNTRPGAAGRIYTEFNYGSELTWMLPGYSPSIDGRTIFPDSIARDFALGMYGRRTVHATAWTSADLALLDRSFWLAPVLDADTAWILLAQGRRTARGSLGALWARRSWWEQWGTAPDVPSLDIQPGDTRAACDLAGYFPAWRSRAQPPTRP
jgi:hypothetical protein